MAATDPISGELIPGTVIVLLAALLVVCIGVSVLVVRRIAQGVPLVAHLPRRVVPWNVFHLLATFTFFVGAMLASVWVFATMGGMKFPLEEEGVAGIAVALGAQASASLLGLLVFLLIARPRWSDMGLFGGLFGKRFGRDVLVGLGAFAVIGPWLYGLNMLLAFFHNGQHPLVEAIEESGDRNLLLLVTASAVLVAPVVEEFFFRVLLQGWLERILAPAAADDTADTAADNPLQELGGTDAGVSDATPHDLPSESSDAPSEHNPFAAPDARVAAAADQWDSQLAAKDPAAEETGIARRIVWSPIVISSIAFSLVHWGHGPAPVPLFFLALLLGYLYQRTHRVLPCIVLHMSLNAFSMAILWLSSV